MKALHFSLIATAFLIGVFAQQNYRKPQIATGECIEDNIRYPTGACDAYLECKNGIAEEKTCPDGLLFNAAANPKTYPCQYPIDVDCTGRSQTQAAQATEDCPHQFGYYRLGDAANCGQFRNCVNGKGFIFDCPEGLAFNEDSYRCDWPDQVPSCDAEAYLGFTCPEDKARQYGFEDASFKFFRSPNDCQHYYICVANRPRLYNCGEGRAFNDLIEACDGVENVTGCVQSPLPLSVNSQFVDNYAPVPLKGNYRQTNYRG